MVATIKHFINKFKLAGNFFSLRCFYTILYLFVSFCVIYIFLHRFYNILYRDLRNILGFNMLGFKKFNFLIVSKKNEILQNFKFYLHFRCIKLIVQF